MLPLRAKGLVTVELRVLEIRNHDIVTDCIVQDVAWLHVTVENVQLANRLEYRDLIGEALLTLSMLSNGGRLAQLRNMKCM